MWKTIQNVPNPNVELDTKSTMDLDTTIKSMSLKPK